MDKKDFGINFTKLENGFKIEFTGDEDMIKAHREVADSWREFMHQVKKVGKMHYEKHHGCCCCDDEDDVVEAEVAKEKDPE